MVLRRSTDQIHAATYYEFKNSLVASTIAAANAREPVRDDVESCSCPRASIHDHEHERDKTIDGSATQDQHDPTLAPGASLLGLPVEVRFPILQYVLQTQPFLDSRQQICSPPELVDRTRTKTLSPFHAPSSYSKGYSESRQADTAILYVCKQLRNEGLGLWYHYRYYLTLIVEQAAVPQLRFRECDQRYFWRRMAQIIKFPSWEVVNRFEKFHLSLFFEQSLFGEVQVDVQAGVGVLNGLRSSEIVGILLGREQEDGQEQVWFEDHTYLELACDAVDDRRSRDHSVEEDRKISLSMEVWRV